jgi:CRP-like cAMP-binding protein
MGSAAPKTISAKPEAELVPRAEDEVLTSDELQLLDLFGNLKKKISVEKFPGSIVLRRFLKGEIICRQGDRGHSAFYIVRSEDIEALRKHRGGDESATAIEETEEAPRQAATAYVLGGPKPHAKGFLPRLFSSRRNVNVSDKPEFIPNDGPADIDYRTRQAPVFEGDVFGEMSCMTLSPRSATVVADEDCYVVEFLRNIFDQMQKDAGYRQRIDELYERRVLSTHLRRLEFFRDLNDAQLTALRDAAHLEVVDPGTVICNEGDESDSIYIIRSGVVQVVLGAPAALRPEDVAEWPAFCKAIVAAADQADSAKQQNPDAPVKTPSSPATADILAAARAKEPPAPTAKDEPSAADILAAARGAPKKTEAQPDETAENTPAANPADILAVARAAAAKGDVTAAKPAKSAMSTADILAAAKKKPSPKPATPEQEEAGDSSSEDASLLRTATPKPCGNAKEAVWEWFEPHVQSAARAIATDESSDDSSRQVVIRAVNQLIRRREFIASKDLAPILEHPDVIDTVRSFPQGIGGAKKDWSELEIRIAGTLAMRVLYPDTFPRRGMKPGPPNILAYLTRGDCFGEMALLSGQRRQATCIAYDHPNDDPRRKPGRVELVRIERAAFLSLLESSPQLKSSVEQMVAARRAEIEKSEESPPWESRHDLTETEEFRDAGLVQGQQLMLIDLDRCTRCGDCVRACVNTHDDGYSRLFLDGPRFDRFLVPSACRQCLNPSCMIGCPVGSIQRGSDGQIEIRDWCIGCGLCARQCPYDSIQMHDVGIIPENAAGWQFAPASAVGGRNWQGPRYRPRGWQTGAAPFHWTLDLFNDLSSRAKDGGWNLPGELPESVYFRYRFQMSREQHDHDQFRLFVTSEGLAAEAWLNGAAAAMQQDAKQTKKGEFEAILDQSPLRRGWNVLAIQVAPPDRSDGASFHPAYHQRLLSVRLDAVPRAGSLTSQTAGAGTNPEVELVTEQAVVCDLCSTLSNQQPACVAQCPHDAAMRIDARFEFPLS